MRIKRGKHYKRIMTFYKTQMGFHEPFNIILDGNFINYCTKVNFDIKRMLGKLVGGIVHIVLTECSFSELEGLSDKLLPQTLDTAI